jgi:hypothetical protein
MIEDEDQTEQDPLMDDNDDGNGKGEDESEADAEMSDEYVSSSGSGGKRRGKQQQQQRIEKEHYYAFTPPITSTMNKPSRQPMMGVNISTLSGEHF